MLLFSVGVTSAQSQPATVIVVRHAEKALEPKDDPPLSDDGVARAQELLQVVRHAGVSVIYSTNRLRNLETARVVAQALKVPIIEVPIESGKVDAHARDIAERVRRDGGDRVSLVVGHSNTLDAIIKAFGGPDVGEIADPRYDDLFVLTVQDGLAPRLIKGKFGVRWESVNK